MLHIINTYQAEDATIILNNGGKAFVGKQENSVALWDANINACAKHVVQKVLSVFK